MKPAIESCPAANLDATFSLDTHILDRVAAPCQRQQMTARNIAAHGLVALAGACEPSRGLGTRVEYAVSQSVPYPPVVGVDGIVTDRLAGSCAAHPGPMTYRSPCSTVGGRN